MNKKNSIIANQSSDSASGKSWLQKVILDLVETKKKNKKHEVMLGDRKAYNRLFEAMRDHTLIYLRPVSGRITYQSVLLDVNLKEQFLLIDELFPNTGFQMFPGDRFEISIGDKRRALHFISELIISGEYAGTPFFKMSLPDVVEEQQRRHNYRVELPERIPGYATWDWPDGQKEVAKISDISMSGVKLQLDSSQDKVKRGARLSRVSLSIGSDLKFESDVDVKYVTKTVKEEQSAVAFLGGQLTAVDPSDHLALQRYMHQLQRTSLRQQHS